MPPSEPTPAPASAASDERRAKDQGLHATLSRFAELVMAETSVSEALRARGEPPAALAELISEDDRLSAVERLDIYAHMFFYRIHDVLWEYLPRTAAALGEDRFWNLLTGYLQRFPSRHPSLRYVGQDLATFAREAEPWATETPWLADLVALEHARLDVSDRADAEALTFEEVREAGDELPTLPLALVPACELLPTRHAVAELWRALGDEAEHGATDELPAPPRETETLLVWRHERAVSHRALGPEEASLMSDLGGGTTFGALCERLATSRAPEEAAAAAVGHVSRWIADGLLRAPARRR